MKQEFMNKELERFNALSPAEASEIVSAAEGQQPDFRSCWYCNGCHDHLKSRDVMICFACGCYYLKGFPADVIIARLNDETVTEKTLSNWIRAVEEAQGSSPEPAFMIPGRGNCASC